MGEAARITSYGGYVEMNYYQYSSLRLGRDRLVVELKTTNQYLLPLKL